VIVLDENVFESQRALLRRWRIHLSQIGRDVGRKGMQDDQIIPLLRKLHRPSLVTRDRDFFNRSLCSDGYCLLYLDVQPLEVAVYVRRLLRQPEFKTWSRRRGCVVRVSASGISAWRTHAARIFRYHWVD
jgi:hypothetical protein